MAKDTKAMESLAEGLGEGLKMVEKLVSAGHHQIVPAYRSIVQAREVIQRRISQIADVASEDDVTKKHEAARALHARQLNPKAAKEPEEDKAPGKSPEKPEDKTPDKTPADGLGTLS